MTTSRRPLLIVPAALAGLALVACSSPYGSSSAAAPTPTTTTIVGASTPALTKASDLRAQLTSLLVEHGYLLAGAAAQSASDAPAQLAANTTDVANLLGQSFGAAFVAPFTQMWTARNADLLAYAKAKQAKDTAGAAAAQTQLTTDVATLAAAIHDANKYLPVHTVTSPATGIGDEITADNTAFTAWVDAAATGDATATAKLVTAAETMAHTADVLAAAGAKLDPTDFPGTATGTAANLRASLTVILVEHVELASLTYSAIATGAGSGPLSVALAANTDAFHNALASSYDDATANTFSTLWDSQLAAYQAYAKAQGAKDDAASAAATGQLITFARSFADFLSHITGGKLSADVVIQGLQAQIADVQRVIQGAATSAPDLFARTRAAVSHAEPAAAALSEAIAEQTPTRYLP